MSTRLLILVNALGCMLLVGLVALQWHKERTLGLRIDGLGQQLSAADEELARVVDEKHALEADVGMLKEGLRRSREDLKSWEQRVDAERAKVTEMAAQIRLANKQLKEWEQAVAQRDRQIGLLVEELKATRERLQEAIEQLKQRR